MFDAISSVFDGFQSFIRVAMQLLVGTIMVFFVGIPLGLGGRPEALMPLAIGGFALYNARKSLLQVKRKLS